MQVNEFARAVVQSASELIESWGRDCFDSVHEVLPAHSLAKSGFDAERQRPIPILFRGVRFDEEFRADLIVHGKVLIELKSVEALANLRKKQVLTYLRLAGLRLGSAIDCNSALIRDPIKRISDLPDELLPLRLHAFARALCLKKF